MDTEENMRESCNDDQQARRYESSRSSLQVYAWQETGAEAAIHAVHDIFKDHTTEALLLIDTENTFNTINREAT